jgi:signal transduction histidine kinase
MDHNQDMHPADNHGPSARGPFWISRPELLPAIMLVVVLLASGTEVVRLISLAGPISAYVAVVVGVVGALFVKRVSGVGLALSSVAPLIAALGNWDPLVEWTVSAFVLFLYVLRRGRALVAGATVAVLTYSAVVLAERTFYNAESLAAVCSAIAVAAVASAIRSQQQYWGELEQRASEAIATRDVEATRRVAEERLRIARDLHDVVGHQVAVLGVQLGAIEVSVGPQMVESKRSFDAARSTVKSILQETQQILSVLRTDVDETGVASLTPAPGISDFGSLVESFRQIGLTVDATLIDTPIGVDPTVDVTSYRVLQEALTNAHRYGDGRAEVQTALANGRISLRVTNDLPVQAQLRRASGGFGLIGMRERVALAGGTLEVEPDGRDFSIHVVLDAGGDKIS